MYNSVFFFMAPKESNEGQDANTNNIPTGLKKISIFEEEMFNLKSYINKCFGLVGTLVVN